MLPMMPIMCFLRGRLRSISFFKVLYRFPACWVPALFNNVITLLIGVLESPTTSCEIRGYAASALSTEFDETDIDFLALAGLPRLLQKVGCRTSPFFLAPIATQCYSSII